MSRLRGNVVLLADGALLLLAIALAWWVGGAATGAWLERAATLEGVTLPASDAVVASAREANLLFSAGVLALLAGRVISALRAKDAIAIPLFVPALVLACLLGLVIHHATVEQVGAAVALPTAARFAQGFLFGAIAAAAIQVVPFDVVALSSRLRIPIALAILAIFVALALAGSGPGSSGVRINLGPVQPIEAVKPLFVLFLAGYLGSRASKLRWQRERFAGLRWPRARLLLPAFLVLIAIFAGLYVVGDLGPISILALVFLGMFYAVTRATGWALVSIGTVASLFALMATWPDLVNVGRVVTRARMWRDPWWNGIPHGDQLGESLWALAAGGGFGQGLAAGATPLVPAGKTDLIVATLGEQLGAAGVVTYLILLAVIVLSGFAVAAKTRTPERALLAGGASLLLAVQWAIIHAGTFGLIPLTGVVVPFLSSGRSSMIALLALAGIVARVAHDGRMRAASDELEQVHAGARGLALACVLALVAGAGLSVHAALESERRSAMGIATELADGTRVIRSNPRLVAIASRLRRGTISDRHGAPLAETGVSRTYPLGASMGTLLGAHPSRVLLPPWALERIFDQRLRGYGEREDGPAGAWPDLRAFVPLLALPEEERRARIEALDGDLTARSVTLTLDARLQREVAALLARREGRGLAAAAVVLDVDTGQVLARAQVPDYDPSDPAWQERMRAAEPAFVERFTGAYGEWPDKTGVQGLFQSGSVGKLFTALAAVRESQASAAFGCVERDAEGPLFTRPGWARPVHDHVRDRNHGRVELIEALAVSCNVYFGQLGLLLGPEPFAALREAGAEVGYGATLDPGAAGSRQLASTAFGQGALAMSVSQAARLVAALGAEGHYRRCSPSMELGAPCEEVALVEDPGALAPILAGMRRVMITGTGRSLEEPEGVRVYGKTGTADVRGFAGEEPFGIARARTAAPHSWFVALAEPSSLAESRASAPGRLAVAVVVPRGGSGATAAGPIAMAILRAARELGYLAAPR